MLDGANTAMLVLAQAAASFSRSELRWEFANTAAAVVFLFLAFAAIAFFCFRRGARDPTLMDLGDAGGQAQRGPSAARPASPERSGRDDS